MDCQGAQEETKGRPGGPEDLKTAGRIPPSSFTSPWSSWPSFCVAKGVRAKGANAMGEGSEGRVPPTL